MRRLWLDEIWGFLDQKNISKKNIKRLVELEATGVEEVVAMANVVRHIALVHPHKGKRWGKLRLGDAELFKQAAKLGLCEDYEYPWRSDQDEDLFGVWIESDGEEIDEEPIWEYDHSACHEMTIQQQNSDQNETPLR